MTDCLRLTEQSVCLSVCLSAPVRHSILKLQAQSNEFKIKYSSLVRMYMLPKPNLPQTVVVLSLDPPIRQGKTFYNHVLLQVRSKGVARG